MVRARRHVSRTSLRKMIEKAVVDCYTEDEQHAGFLAVIQDRISCPVPARVVGEDVIVLGFDQDEGWGDIVAKCRRGGRIYPINVTALEWPGRPSKGIEWIEAYRAWLKGAV